MQRHLHPGPKQHAAQQQLLRPVQLSEPPGTPTSLVAVEPVYVGGQSPLEATPTAPDGSHWRENTPSGVTVHRTPLCYWLLSGQYLLAHQTTLQQWLPSPAAVCQLPGYPLGPQVKGGGFTAPALGILLKLVWVDSS
jgi:hypothetical protein